jgi:diguanylate cyclase (GGDEF)-like protein
MVYKAKHGIEDIYELILPQYRTPKSTRAYYEILTILPNRVLLADRLSQAMLQCSLHQQSLVVVFIDLDGFKSINDAHVNKVGDGLLIASHFS